MSKLFDEKELSHDEKELSNEIKTILDAKADIASEMEELSDELAKAPVTRSAVPGPELFECPVCGSKVFEEKGGYEICPVCGWEDDPVQRRDPGFAGGANKMSLNEAVKAFANGERVK